MGVLIDNRQNHRSVDLQTIEKKATAVLDALGSHNGELSILVVDDAAIRELNREYRGKDRPTNVLAFAMQEGAFADLTPGLLGDVVISMETADREAQAAGVSVGRHFDELLIHGILHLLGYDHEIDDAAESAMMQKSRELMAIIAAMP